jgi:hypothetical protein
MHAEFDQFLKYFQLFFSYIIQVGEHVRLTSLVMLKLRENIYKK